MAPNEMGVVFGHLLRWREISGNPPGRPMRDGERDAAALLADCNGAALQDFEEFLNAQGFSLISREGIEFGIPPKPGRPNTIWVLTRRRGEPLAPYVNARWYVEAMRERRSADSETRREEVIFWTARLWLTLQWFFYEKIDRLPSEISRYREALVSRAFFEQELAAGIERLGNAGRPEGPAGVVWDHFWKSKDRVKTWAGRFLKTMHEAGMIEDTGNRDEWRQTVLAAIEMHDYGIQEVAYMMPPKDSAAVAETTELLLGERLATDAQAEPQ